jgi:hypothetical protein
VARHKRIELRPDLEHQWHYKLNPDGSKTLQIRPDLRLEHVVDMVNDMDEDDEERCRNQRPDAATQHSAHDAADRSSRHDEADRPETIGLSRSTHLHRARA